MALPPEDCGAGGIDIDLPQTAVRIDDLELIDPAVALALERDADHLAAEIRTHPRQDLGQGQRLAVLDVAGFPVMLRWYVVHLRQKVLAPVAVAFKEFLLQRGAGLIDQVTGQPSAARRRR